MFILLVLLSLKNRWNTSLKFIKSPLLIGLQREKNIILLFMKINIQFDKFSLVQRFLSREMTDCSVILCTGLRLLH